MTYYTAKITEYDTESFPSNVKKFAGRVDFEGEGWPRYVERFADTEAEVLELLRSDIPEVLKEREEFSANMQTLNHEISTREIGMTV